MSFFWAVCSIHGIDNFSFSDVQTCKQKAEIIQSDVYIEDQYTNKYGPHPPINVDYLTQNSVM